MLKAFKEEDPNGNGKQDEIPWTASGLGQVMNSLYGAWGLRNRGIDHGNVDMDEENGKLRFIPVQPEYREMLEYLNKLYTEGLLDQEIFTMDVPQLLLRIVLPLSAPILAVMVMYYGVGHWNAYFTALIYFRDRGKFPLQLILREILIKNDMNRMTEGETLVSQELLSEGIKYAVIVVASVPVLLLYPFLQKYFVKGVMIGALKG